MSRSPVKCSYQGIIITDQYLQVHFNVGNGSWMRHQHVKIPLSEFLTDEVTQKLDRFVRRRLIEIWSEQPVPDLVLPWED